MIWCVSCSILATWFKERSFSVWVSITNTNGVLSILVSGSVETVPPVSVWWVQDASGLDPKIAEEVWK